MIEAEGSAATGVCDPVAGSLIGLLRSEGADASAHAGGRTLLEHLIGTYEIVRRWEQPKWLQHAALLHSVYGTEAHPAQLITPSRRRELAGIAGDQAERLAYLFCVTPRGPLLAGTHRWARGLRVEGLGDAAQPTRAELDCLVLLHMANLADQAQAADGSPGVWLVRLRELGELVADSEEVHPPPFLATLAATTAEEERSARRAYRRGVVLRDADQLALCAALCPVIAEPCLWLAHLATSGGDRAAARAWAQAGQARLQRLGTAWDRRLSHGEWCEIAAAFASGAVTPAASAADPRGLLEAARSTATAGRHRPEAAGGRERFHRYVEGLSTGSAVGIYPDLPSRPWYSASEFSLVRELESREAEIRGELLALEPARFQPEREAIDRTGEWDVVFLYERGRPGESVLKDCPATARALRSPEVMRSPAGLIYVSRMRPGTRIAPHRGPTNLRIRCHLGLHVPEGDCAIRVGEETRGWREGRCLVFDDHFEHEAWNLTEEDRLVLIIDLWQPGLSAMEVSLLSGLQEQMRGYARRLAGYWERNEPAVG